MTNKLEQDKQIIASAPEGATHFDGDVWSMPISSELGVFMEGNIRSLDDIRENIALQERIAELEKWKDCACERLTGLSTAIDVYVGQIAELEKLNKTIESLMRSGERRGREKAKEKYSKALTQKDKRIAELRHENLILKAHYCLDRISGNIDTIMLDKMQVKRDLEQQAKGLDNFKIPDLRYTDFHCVGDELIKQAKQLRQQAKGGDL